MVAKKIGNRSFRVLSLGHLHDKSGERVLIGLNENIVDLQKCDHGGGTRPFVAIDKGIVLNDMEQVRQSERNKSAKMRRAGQAGRGTRARRIKEDTFSERNEALLVRRKQICLFISFGLPKRQPSGKDRHAGIDRQTWLAALP